MSLSDYARNIYAPSQFVDVNVITVVIVNGSTPRDPTRSSPDTTVVDATNGAYTVTMPSGVKQVCVGQEMVNATTEKVSVTALSSANGRTTFTATASGGAALAAGEEMHLTFLVFNQ